MRLRARELVTVLLLAAVAFGCGRKEQQPPAASPPAAASPRAAVAVTMALAAASSPAATTATGPPPRVTAPAVSATARPATTAAPATTQAAPPPAPPLAAASAPPPTTQAEKPAPTQPAAPARPAAARPKGKITLPAKLGAVTFDHEKHAGESKVDCTTCHHPSRTQKPLASENQACRECHTTPAPPPMKTSRQAAFHDPKAATGTCIDCHKQKAGKAPVKCLECHKKK